jgi:tRNA threonylcarbamoyladenosine biosynthesis protein TsaB
VPSLQSACGSTETKLIVWLSHFDPAWGKKDNKPFPCSPSVKILAIETSMGQTSVALATGQFEDPILVKRLPKGEPQAEKLIPLVRDLMAAGELRFQDLGRVAVCIGPGGFSGIRAGVAAARGIGLAARLPVVGATSFQIMAAAFHQRQRPTQAFGIAAPAGATMVYCQIFAPDEAELSEIAAVPASEVGRFFGGKITVLTGPSAASLSEAGHICIPVEAPDLVPDAAVLGRLAASLTPDRHPPSPHYVRPADAKPQTGYAVDRKPD